MDKQIPPVDERIPPVFGIPDPIKPGPDTLILPAVNNNYFPIVQHLIIHAQKQILIIMFEIRYRPGCQNCAATKMVNTLFNIHIRRRGIEIKVIMPKPPHGAPLEWVNVFAKKILEENNIPIKFTPLGRLTHAKLVIIDSSVVVLGSHNWSTEAMSRSNETSIAIYDKNTALFFSDYFHNLWSNTKHG